MPSKLPVIKANTTQENISKMKVIAENNKRSLAKELELIVENHIRAYEAEHGEIVIREPEKPEMRIPLLDPYHLGVKAGETAADIVIDQVKKRKGKKQEAPEKPG